MAAKRVHADEPSSTLSRSRNAGAAHSTTARAAADIHRRKRRKYNLDNESNVFGAGSHVEGAPPEAEVMDIALPSNDELRPLVHSRDDSPLVHGVGQSSDHMQEELSDGHSALIRDHEIDLTDVDSLQDIEASQTTPIVEDGEWLKFRVDISKAYGVISKPATLQEITDDKARMEGDSGETAEACSPWSEREQTLFFVLVRDHGRNWKRMADYLPHRNEGDVETHFHQLLDTRPELELDKIATAADAVVDQGDRFGHTNTVGNGRFDSRGPRMWLG